MAEQTTDAIESWHAHVYFDADSRDRAMSLYERVKERFTGAKIGRFHEKPVGPHPMWSYQIHFPMPLFPEVAGWLALNRDGLDVFVHPNTGDDLADHRDHTIWIGRSYELDLSIFKE